jgi:hypothetical protein
LAENDALRYILDDLNGKIKNSAVEADCVLIPDLSLSIKVHPPVVEESDGLIFLTLYISISHPSFYDETIETYFPAQAAGFEEAVQIAVRMFFTGLMSAVFEYLQGSETSTFNTSFYGTNKSWSVLEGDLLLINREDGDSLWKHIKDGVSLRLGNLPFYYIDAFVGEHENGECEGECSVNGELSLELSGRLEKDIKKYGTAGYMRQFFLVSQNSPFAQYPYERKEIERYTEKALSLFEHSGTEETYKNLLENIYALTKDIDLACELKSFIPEICAELFYKSKGVSFSETVVLMKESGEFTAYKDQITAYRWIKERLCRGFENEEFSSDLFRRLISISATHSVIAKAKKENGGEMDFMVQTALNVPTMYELR